MQQASGAEDVTARAEWHSLAGLLAQVILAHLPSIPDHDDVQHRIAALVDQLLLFPVSSRAPDRYSSWQLLQTCVHQELLPSCTA